MPESLDHSSTSTGSINNAGLGLDEIILTPTGILVNQESGIDPKMAVFSINTQSIDGGLLHINSKEEKKQNTHYNTFLAVPAAPSGGNSSGEVVKMAVVEANNNHEVLGPIIDLSGVEKIPEKTLPPPRRMSLNSVIEIPVKIDKGKPSSGAKKESWFKILKEVCFPFIFAGLGMVGAGLLLDMVKETKVFVDIPEFIVVVTPLLGLKGNLEMTLAARLSTLSNLGLLESSRAKTFVFMGNIALTQVQATGVGFLSGLVAIGMGRFDEDAPFQLNNLILLCTACLMTATVVSFFLGSLMMGVIVLTKKLNVNPDNIATPIAASLGDVTTLFFLSIFGNFLHANNLASTWICPAIIGVFLMLMFLWIWVAAQEVNCWNVLRFGWTPIISAMLISSCGGMLLDKAADRFEGVTLYQPLINGIGGNLVSIQASRISTSLYLEAKESLKPVERTLNSCFVSPIKAFFKDGIHSVAARVLLGLVVPGQIFFATLIHFTSGDNSEFSPEFFLLYVSACTIQVMILLYLARVLVNVLWVKNYDPDTWSIPFLTSLGDLIGTSLLFVAFFIMSIL